MKGKRLSRGVGYGNTCNLHVNGHEAIEWIKSKIQEDIKLEQGMKNHCLKYNKN